MVRTISVRISSRRYRAVGARFTARCSGVDGIAAMHGREPFERAHDADRVRRDDRDDRGAPVEHRTAQRRRAVDVDHDVLVARAQLVDDVEHLAGRDLCRGDRAGEPGDHPGRPRAERCDDRVIERAQAVCARFDRAAQVRLEPQTEPARDRGRGVVRVDQHDRAAPMTQRGGEADRDLGDAAAPGPRDDDERAPFAGRSRSASTPTGEWSTDRGVPASSSRTAATNSTMAASAAMVASTPSATRWSLPGRLVGIEHAEHAPTRVRAWRRRSRA